MKTSLLTKCTAYNFEKLFKEKGYAWFTKGNYNLNIVGVRSNNNNKITNQYDDILVVDYNTGTCHKRVCYTITTEPGKYYMYNLGNPKGTAILVPGQYRGCWQIGLHRGKYKALCQKKAVKVYRDDNKNITYDMTSESIDKGIFGINIHRSNEAWTRNTIDKYSAGCQVFNNPVEFNAFIRLCEEQRKLYGNSFTYTLINEGGYALMIGMYDSNDSEEVVTGCLTNIIIALVSLTVIILGSIAIYKHCTGNKNTVTNSTIEYVDYIKKENDKLILEVNNLDSLKNAEIIEVKSLDNDSTVKLFYKLIRE